MNRVSDGDSVPRQSLGVQDNLQQISSQAWDFYWVVMFMGEADKEKMLKPQAKCSDKYVYGGGAHQSDLFGLASLHDGSCLPPNVDTLLFLRCHGS